MNDTTAFMPPANLRDLGGTPLPGGGAVAPGFAVRADDLTRIPDDTADRLVADGLAAVIDLRSNDEAQRTGRGPLASREVTYHHISLTPQVGGLRQIVTQMAGRTVGAHGGAGAAADGPGSLAALAGIPPQTGHQLFGHMYADTYEHWAARIVQALAIIATTDGTTAFHCAIGRDRTGILAASLLMVLGADDDAIIADYVRTEAAVPALMEREKGQKGLVMGDVSQESLPEGFGRFMQDGSHVAMETFLHLLRERHGDPLAPLRAAGLDGGLTGRLRERGVVGS